MAPTETVLCQSVNSVQITHTVQRVLDCVRLALQDLLLTRTGQNAVKLLIHDTARSLDDEFHGNFEFSYYHFEINVMQFAPSNKFRTNSLSFFNLKLQNRVRDYPRPGLR